MFLTAIFLSVFALSINNVKAADFGENQSVDSKKTWTIKFNGEVKFDDSCKEAITVTNSKGIKEKVGLQLGDDKKTIKVTAPEEGYILGENYILNVGTKVQSVKNKALKNERNLRFSIKNTENKTLNSKFQTKIKSANLSVDYNINEVLSEIDKFQLNTLNIPVKININALSSSDMEVNAESKEKAISLVKQLQGKNMNVILEAYPWIENGNKSETDWSPDNTNTFFWNWKTKVLQSLIDDIANPYNVEALNIASNFAKIEFAEGYWCDTIDYVRENYKGLITYRTNYWVTAQGDVKSNKEYEDKLNNRLFSKVDFISIGAYFELTNSENNTVENLVSAIESTQVKYGDITPTNRKQNVKKEIKNFYDKYKKPIFFGELGFPRINGASMKPCDPFANSNINNVEQANCFEAYKREFENEPWLLGFSVFAIGDQGSDKKYYPSEESTKIIKKWYNN